MYCLQVRIVRSCDQLVYGTHWTTLAGTYGASSVVSYIALYFTYRVRHKNVKLKYVEHDHGYDFLVFDVNVY